MLGGKVTGGARKVLTRLGAAAVALGGGIGLTVAWAAPAAATTYVVCYWTGAGANTGFSEPDADADVVSEVPPSGAIVEFPSGETHTTVTWDAGMTSTGYNSVTVDSGYTLISDS